MVDARDVAAGLVTLAARGRAGERYILTSREGNVSHAEFFRRLREVTGVRRRMVRLPRPLAVALTTLAPWPVKPGEARAAAHWWFYTPAKAEAELGFRVRPLEGDPRGDGRSVHRNLTQHTRLDSIEDLGQGRAGRRDPVVSQAHDRASGVRLGRHELGDAPG